MMPGVYSGGMWLSVVVVLAVVVVLGVVVVVVGPPNLYIGLV